MLVLWVVLQNLFIPDFEKVFKKAKQNKNKQKDYRMERNKI